MAVERTSTSLVRYLGATVRASNNEGSLSNLVSNGQGSERVRSPGPFRLANEGQSAASVKIADYQAALGYLLQRGASPLVAKTMAAVFVDVAKSQGTSVMSLLESSNSDAISLVNPGVFNRVNQLRDLTSQLTTSNPINNSKSTKSRFIRP